MKRLATAGVCLALALLTFFQFPGHTWLQQDTQIYVPILEHERDATVLRNDILVQHPHLAYTLYDEISIALRGATGLGFREVLAVQLVATRALGIWGLLMLAEALGLAFGNAVTLAAICSLGAMIAGPQVLTVEYEPTPRAFAVPLLICAMWLLARGWNTGAGLAMGAAVLYHVPTALPFVCVCMLLALRKRSTAVWPLASAFVLLLLAPHGGEEQRFFGTVMADQEMLQRLRTAYV